MTTEEIHTVSAPKPKSKYARMPMVPVPPVGTVASRPDSAPARPTKYDWVGARKLLEENPGMWVLVFNDFSSGMYAFARRGGPGSMHGMGGHFQVSLRNQKVKDKTSYGSLWMRWIPEGWTDEHQRIAEATAAAGEGSL
jgi:hypothetical protein